MKIQFTYPLGPTVAQVEYDTAERLIRYNGMCIPFANCGQALQAAATKAKTDFQRQQLGQSGHALMMGK